MRIKFINVIKRPGYINVDYEYGEIKHYIEFELTDPIIVRDDLIAYSLACLCGRKYDSIFMDLKVSLRTKATIEKHTGAKLKCHIDLNEYTINKSFDNETLNFSGGFDSLAALAFLPRNSSLVAMDFGGDFNREMSIIKKFNSHIVKTNIIETDFRRNSWLFMVIGSILYKDYLNSDFNVFGSVMLSAVLSDSRFIKNASTPLLIEGAGMSSIPYTLGLTEIGALRIAAHYFPEHINESLISLASEGSEKRYRKQLYLEIENERFNSNIEITNPVKPLKNPHFKWGDVFQADHLALYILKFKGYEVASTMVSDIPGDAEHLLENMSLDFFTKYHPDNVHNIPENQRERFFKVLEGATVSVYSTEDLDEYETIKNYLSNWYEVR
ncbi:hypothetical protein [Jeotgalicoccus halotolerans]|uniref:Uncharacterized protein n=1 Tax=Jeotgalicoccus halotolerans TaxID=157227 RepID=A0A3E0B1R2_9STAP|nr:hypothetical protein [Jeotgalicoccus halotolerans]REG25877.1 hypothetical protein DFR63_0925 [Jeotgalicoccus halotolerans]